MCLRTRSWSMPYLAVSEWMRLMTARRRRAECAARIWTCLRPRHPERPPRVGSRPTAGGGGEEARIGSSFLDPGFSTVPSYRLLYRALDVTKLIRTGQCGDVMEPRVVTVARLWRTPQNHTSEASAETYPKGDGGGCDEIKTGCSTTLLRHAGLWPDAPKICNFP